MDPRGGAVCYRCRTMSGPRTSVLIEQEESSEEQTSEHELALRDGRRLAVKDEAAGQLVEIRNDAGMLELRIKLTADGPVLQMEGVRLELRAQESVQIASPRVEIKGSEKVEVSGGQVDVRGEEGVNVDSPGDVKVVGKMIYLN